VLIVTKVMWLICTAFITAFVIMRLFNWFVAEPFNIQTIYVWHAMGLGVLVRTTTLNVADWFGLRATTKEKMTEQQFVNDVILFLSYNGVTMVFGYIIHLMM
jgi:hypothetical protein